MVIPHDKIQTMEDLQFSVVHALELQELEVFIESQSGCQIDFSDIEPSKFCVVRQLCRITLKSQRN